MRLATLLLCLLGATGCAEKNPVTPSTGIGSPFTLTPGQSAVVTGTNIRLQFVRVSSDSRCPTDVQCVWAGDAVIVVRATDASASANYDLHTGDPKLTAARHSDVLIELLQLQPYPASGRSIEPSDYRATLQVRR
jgi:hypothetical protein